MRVHLHNFRTTRPSPMDDDCEELQVLFGIIKGITFSISNNTDREKISVLTIESTSEVTDPRLGLPNPSTKCVTCGSKDRKNCEGHFGVIKFPYTIIHPYFLSETAKLLNKVCPGCKCIRQEQRSKVLGSESSGRPRRCRYCHVNTWYPPVTFRVSSKDLFRKTAIVVEVSEKSLIKLRKRGKVVLPDDYWDFIPKDSNLDESCLKPTRRVLTHAQVYSLLSGIDTDFIRKFIPMFDSLYLKYFPVTPNGHRVTEFVHSFNGQRLVFDERTRIYKKLVDFRGHGLELSSRVIECLQFSKLYSETTASSQESANPYGKKSDSLPKLCGLRFMKDVILGKRNNNSFRTVVVGDPSLKLNEIGIPCRIAERLQISENLNNWNWERLVACCDLRLLEKGEVYVRRGENLVSVHSIDDLQVGDNIFRPLTDGDIVLMNRPPSIHQHSLIAMSIKVLPVTSVVSLNPICCSPFRGDFDGDCFHGYVPQSLEARVELNELIALDKQLINGQNGRNLLSLGQDSLTAAYLVNEEADYHLNHFQVQQLQMSCPYGLPSPAIIKATNLVTGSRWTGKQLFSMLLPPGFDYSFPLNDVVVSKGELLSSEGSAWLRDGEGNIIKNLVSYDENKVLDILYSAQVVLCEWLSMRGLSVSLSDLYLCSDLQSRENMMEEISWGLEEAKQTCNFRQMMVDSCLDLLAGNDDKEDHDPVFDADKLCYERQRSAAISQVSIDAFKLVFRDIQTLAYRYGGQDNSLLAMSKSGSKGNAGKLVQHCMCLGLQHSLVPLSFGFPRELSCAGWNDGNAPLGLKGDDKTSGFARSFIPYGVIENSFLTGLNPLESFVHSVTSRDSSFSDNADIPGTLSRRLMFFMRDLYRAYDGTVRNTYGNQLVQFSYITDDCKGLGGEPVGSLSACAITEAAYSALDQPISPLETSPLLNLKNVLECGSKKGAREQAMSLYLSKKLGRHRHGFEYGALEVKDHLEKLTFSEIVSVVMIIYSPQTDKKAPLSPWVCHFHIPKEVAKRRRLEVEAIIVSLYERYTFSKKEIKLDIADLQMTSYRDCSIDSQEMPEDMFCVTVTVVEANKKSSLEMDAIRDTLIPFLLGTVVKGFQEIKKVEILWNDRPKVLQHNKNLSGELYLRVSMSGDCGNRSFWSALMDDCLQIMDLIDWTRSHPENIRQCCSAYGIDAGIRIFLANLKSAISDTGKSILPQHLLLVANCLSITGEFVSLNAKGWAKQRLLASAPSPFTQACFSSPSACFLKAAKEGTRDELQGTIDALAWGNVPSFGTGGQFDIIYSSKDHGFTKPVDVYDLLSSTSTLPKNCAASALNRKSDKSGPQPLYMFDTAVPKALKTLTEKSISKSYLKSVFTWNDIQKLSRALRNILHKYPVNHRLNEGDQRTLMMALYFHPHRDQKIGSGVQEIKVGCHVKHENVRCFQLVRTDGTMEDFSYHKCVVGALEIIAPGKVDFYKSKWLNHGTELSGLKKMAFGQEPFML